MNISTSDPIEKAKAIFQEHGGMLRTREAIKARIHPRTLYVMWKAGVVEQISRGVYRLADLPPLSNPDLVAVAKRIPDGVICLISALAYHEITTQIPHEVHIALAEDSRPPRLDYPPLRIFWFRGSAFTEGIESHSIDNVPVRIYCPEKTLADCFKYRNKIGLDIAMEALRLYRHRKGFNVDKVMHYARICRVGKVMRPYVEGVL
ncbi:MAG: type IV toxin-antitoxin system AbiEi family antitoxin domain-containing protein [Planctomycetota bacterium]